MRRLGAAAVVAAAGTVGMLVLPAVAQAQTPPFFPLPSLQIGVGAATNPGQVAVTLQMLLLLTVLSLAPSIIILLTSFTRIIIVFSFLRSALGSQTSPPNQVLIGFALILTFFIMAPVFNQINNQALQPYLQGTISQTQAVDKGMEPLRSFMLRQTGKKDIALFLRLAKQPPPRTPSGLQTYVLLPAFVTSELQTAFEMGFLIFIPFLILDMVVASTLMSMGMMMLPPTMISLPFKILLFVLADGWALVVQSLVTSFH